MVRGERARLGILADNLLRLAEQLLLDLRVVPSPRITQRSITSSGTLHARSRSGAQDSSFAVRTAIFSSGFSIAAIHGSCTRLDSATGMSSFAAKRF